MNYDHREIADNTSSTHLNHSLVTVWIEKPSEAGKLGSERVGFQKM